MTKTVLIEWKKEYMIGIPAIDAQHKELVGILNSLHEAMCAGQGRRVLGKTFDDLVSYTQRHFEFEERLMLSRSYRDYPQHKEEHMRLAKTVMDYKKGLSGGATGNAMEVVQFLKNWLINHIAGSDMRMASVLR